MTLTKRLWGLLIFLRLPLVGVLGFAAGTLFMGFLAAHASRVFLDAVRVAYVLRQEERAVCAKRKGDMGGAAAYFANAASAYAPEGRQAWANDLPVWRVWFPLGALILEKCLPSVNPSAREMMVMEGHYRAMEAAALEKARHQSEAATEYATAARLLGREGDLSRPRQLAKIVAKYEGWVRCDAIPATADPTR